MKVYGELIRAQAEILAADPSVGLAGRLWFNSTSKKLKFDTGTNIIDTTDAVGAPPVGSVMTWFGGYFGIGANNNGFTDVLGNTIAAADAYLNPLGYYVCDGKQVNDVDSPIFNGAGRYLPQLTDDRFLMGIGTTTLGIGATTALATGGSNLMIEHTHTVVGSTLNAAGQTLGATNKSLDSGSAAGQTLGATNKSLSDGTVPPYDVSNRPLVSGVTNKNQWNSNQTSHRHQVGNSARAANNGTTYTVPGEEAAAGALYTAYTSIAWASANATVTGTVDIDHTHGTVTGTTDITHSHGPSAVTGTTNITHSHGPSAVTGSIGTGSAAGSTDNRPAYLACFYIMRVK